MTPFYIKSVVQRGNDAVIFIGRYDDKEYEETLTLSINEIFKIIKEKNK